MKALETRQDRPATPTEALTVAEAVLAACRNASLRLGTPRLASLGVTSTLRGEGRTTIAVGMAAAQREAFGRPVVLIDLDLENPRLARRLGRGPVPGICEVIRGENALSEAVQPLDEGVYFVPAGLTGASVTRSVNEVGRAAVLAKLAAEFGMVVADLPPLLGSSVGRAAAPLVEELLLVVRAGLTPVARIKEATANLPSEPAVLLNGTYTALPAWVRRMVGI